MAPCSTPWEKDEPPYELPYDSLRLRSTTGCNVDVDDDVAALRAPWVAMTSALSAAAEAKVSCEMGMSPGLDAQGTAVLSSRV